MLAESKKNCRASGDLAAALPLPFPPEEAVARPRDEERPRLLNEPFPLAGPVEGPLDGHVWSL